METTDAPKVFISYAWSSEEHRNWVKQLAEELVSLHHVEVLIDVWDLNEGQSTTAFMEKMVNDPDIKKVLIISDQTYAEKANARTGGVGTETQIISTEVYAQHEQTKFIAVIPPGGKNADGKPYLPTNLKDRLYFDLSDDTIYYEKMETLARKIHGKSLGKRPELGPLPPYLGTAAPTPMKTQSLAFRATEAIRNGRANATGVVLEYLDAFVVAFENLRIADWGDIPDETFMQNIESFLPERDAILKLFIVLAQYQQDDQLLGDQLHDFFEQLTPYIFPNNGMSSWLDRSFDNYKFIIHELFIYTVAILIKKKRWYVINIIIGSYYPVPEINYSTDLYIKNCSIFGNDYDLSILEERNKRLQKNYIIVKPVLIHDRCSGSIVQFRELMQADFLLFMRTAKDAMSTQELWIPTTLIYATRQNKAFELFALAASRKHFDKIKIILNINSPEDLTTLFTDFHTSRNGFEIDLGGFNRYSPRFLLGFDKWCTVA